jgi:hypothetical protein
MRKHQLLVIGSMAFCAALLAGQSPPPTLLGPLPKIQQVHARGDNAEFHTFEFDGQQYRVQLSHSDILSGPEWNPSLPLPLSFAKVEGIARQQLRKLGAEDEALPVTGFEVRRLLGVAEPRWYYAVTFRSALDIRGEAFDRVTLLVSLGGGQPGQIMVNR